LTIPTTIIAGFLGAGKTTLVNHLLTSAPVKLGVLVNDFADINIDAALIAEAHPERIALSNGCVCCTIRDDLIVAALELAASTPPPDRIIVETSGVSHPGGVVAAFQASHVADRLTVDGTFCLVDAAGFPDLVYADSELAIDQAAAADIVLLNKCDLAGTQRVGQVESTLRGALPAMRILRTKNAWIPWSILADLPDAEEQPASAATRGLSHHHQHDQEFISWSWTCDRPLLIEEFRHLTRQLPPGILRAKGIVRFADRPGECGVFQMVGKRSTLVLASDPLPNGPSALVFIGRGGSLDPAQLRALLGGPSRDAPAELPAAGRHPSSRRRSPRA
jgi:G3E family GTPase